VTAERSHFFPGVDGRLSAAWKFLQPGGYTYPAGLSRYAKRCRDSFRLKVISGEPNKKPGEPGFLLQVRQRRLRLALADRYAD